MIWQSIGSEATAYIEALVSALPGASGGKLRAFYMRRRLSFLGKSATLSPGFRVFGAEAVHIGDSFFCDRGCSLYADGGGSILIGTRVALNSNVSINAAIGGVISIGSGVLIGPNVLMRATDHAFAQIDVPIWQQGHTPGRIDIGDDVWIGGNVTILGGTSIGKGAIVAAGAVVNKNVPDFAIVGGVPARVLKWRRSASV